ncbi:MAG: hypothetical protein ACYDC1_06325 [Limisphaerales bacterium]
MKAKGSLSMTDFEEAMRADLRPGGGSKVVEPVPVGWHTLREVAQLVGMSASQTSARVRGLVAAGKWETHSFRIVSGQVVRPVPHYRPTLPATGASKKKPKQLCL